MNSKIFSPRYRAEMEKRALGILKKNSKIMSAHTVESPRAVGDAVEKILADNIEYIVGARGREFSAQFARRAMADMAFETVDGFYCLVDVKTHRQDADFSMPQLTSVERLASLYGDDSNIFSLMSVKYGTRGGRLVFHGVSFFPVEWLDWKCLTIGNLGWGQIQIANSNNIKISPRTSRVEWMITLCDRVLDFYPREIDKISKRIFRFKAERRRWLAKRRAITGRAAGNGD